MEPVGACVPVRAAVASRRACAACSPRGECRIGLELLGYEVVARRRYLYASPWSHPSAGEAGGKILRPRFCESAAPGAYLLKARKRVYTLTPVRPRFREKTPVIGRLVKPTTRSSP